jgi:hypothetical protein
LALLLCAGCRRAEPSLVLHYLPDFVPGTQNVLAPTAIAIAPPGGLANEPRIEVGAVFAPDGTIQRKLYAADLETLLARSLAQGLRDAGLKPVLIAAMPADYRPPAGAAFMLITRLDAIEVNKRFGAELTVHGRYFKMRARVRISLELCDRSGRKVLVDQVTGVEDEPPVPVGGEVFLPLETDPAESLSVALSRAIGAIILLPEMRRLLGVRSTP